MNIFGLGRGGQVDEGDRWKKFTKRARAVIALAQEEAQRFNHNYIGTEHLLLGLIRESDGVAAQVLAALGIELAKVRSAVEHIIGRGDRALTGEIGLTPRARKVIELAVDESRSLGHHYTGTEHLLLGLVREGEGIAAGVLVSMGAKLPQVRRETLRILAEQGTIGTRKFAEAAAPKDNVITCRITDEDLAAIDTLIEAGIRTTRSDAASWLIHSGVVGQRELLAKVGDTVAQIRRLREEAQMMAQEHATGDPGPKAEGEEHAPEEGPDA